MWQPYNDMEEIMNAIGGVPVTPVGRKGRARRRRARGSHAPTSPAAHSAASRDLAISGDLSEAAPLRDPTITFKAQTRGDASCTPRTATYNIFECLSSAVFAPPGTPLWSIANKSSTAKAAERTLSCAGGRSSTLGLSRASPRSPSPSPSPPARAVFRQPRSTGQTCASYAIVSEKDGVPSSSSSSYSAVFQLPAVATRRRARSKGQKGRSYTPTQLEDAVRKILYEGMSLGEASLQFPIPKSTLRTYMLKSDLLKKEDKVKSWIKAMLRLGNPRLWDQLPECMQHEADQPSEDGGLAQSNLDEWQRVFFGRHKTLKKLKDSSRGFPGPFRHLRKWISGLESHLKEEGLEATEFLNYSFERRIFSYCEIGVCLCGPGNTSGSFIFKDDHMLNVEGDFVSVVSCVSASGEQIKNFHVSSEVPGGSPRMGWAGTQSFVSWLQSFILQLNVLELMRPVFLFLDSSPPFIDVPTCQMAQESGVILHCIPQYYEGWLQPLRHSLASDLESKFRSILEGAGALGFQKCTAAHIPVFFEEAWEATLSAPAIARAFRQSCLCPFSAKDLSFFHLTSILSRNTGQSSLFKVKEREGSASTFDGRKVVDEEDSGEERPLAKGLVQLPNFSESFKGITSFSANIEESLKDISNGDSCVGSKTYDSTDPVFCMDEESVYSEEILHSSCGASLGFNFSGEDLSADHLKSHALQAQTANCVSCGACGMGRLLDDVKCSCGVSFHRLCSGIPNHISSETIGKLLWNCKYCANS